MAVRSHTPPAPALRAEKSSTAASCRGGRSPASTSTGGLHRGTVAATGPAASGSESMCTQRCGQRGRDISDGEVRCTGSSHLSVSSIYIMTIQSVRALAPPARAGPALGAEPSGRGPRNPVILPNLVVVTKPNKVEKEKLPILASVASRRRFDLHVMIAVTSSRLRTVSRARPATACHTRGTLVRHASLRRRTRHLSSPSSACGLAWEEPMGASSPHLVAALSLAVNTRSSSSKLSFLAFSMAPLAL